jgi:hypothetical protein
MWQMGIDGTKVWDLPCAQNPEMGDFWNIPVLAGKRGMGIPESGDRGEILEPTNFGVVGRWLGPAPL